VRVVVTGGAGFIGANLCRILGQAAWVDRVICLDDLSSGHLDNLLGVRASVVEGSILDNSALDEAFADADAVVHLAARPSVPRSIADPLVSHEVNVTGTARVLEAVRRHRIAHSIIASSSSVYGGNLALPKREDMAAMPLSPYAATKLAAESYALAWANSYELDVLVFRFFNVFGPLQPAGHAYAAVVPTFIHASLAGRPLPVHGDGYQTRDFTFVDTVTEVIADTLRRRVSSSQPVNLAFGTRTSLIAFIAVLESVLGRSLKREHVPPRAGDVRDSQADQTLLRSLFPDAQAVPLEQGLRATVDWFREAQASQR
jgi:UDP-glucose 4-epimerase